MTTTHFGKSAKKTDGLTSLMTNGMSVMDRLPFSRETPT